MTARQAYEALLVELDKVKAPAILLDDFNYLFNKVTYIYVSKLFDGRHAATQTEIDKLSSVMATIRLDVVDNEVSLPKDYYRLLNCFVSYSGDNLDKCGNGVGKDIPARQLNPARSEEVFRNYYLRPTFHRPYYQFIYNAEDYTPNQGNSIDIDFSEKYDVDGYMDNSGSNFSRTITVTPVGSHSGFKSSVVERDIAVRYGKPTDVKIQLFTGDSKYAASSVKIDYIKAPQHIKLTPEQMDLVEDTSQILEWDELATHEIISVMLESLVGTMKVQKQ